MTLGLRYTHETKGMTAAYNNSDGGAACLAGLTKYQQAGALYVANGGNAAAAVGAGANPYWIGAIAAGKATTLVGALCPFWANPYFSNPALGGDRHVSDSKTGTNVSGTVKAAWHVTSDVMSYVSYARGYKAGGFNLDRAQTGVTPDGSLWFLPETVNSYELGIKSSLLNKSMMLNVSLFDQEYENFQLNTFLGTAFIVESIPSLKSRGLMPTCIGKHQYLV